jgi:hypothetical protein
MYRCSDLISIIYLHLSIPKPRNLNHHIHHHFSRFPAPASAIIGIQGNIMPWRHELPFFLGLDVDAEIRGEGLAGGAGGEGLG